MGRYRSRSRSYSPRRRKRYDDPRDSRSRRDRRSPAPSGLLVRNISLDARPEDLRIPFERFGPLKDVYLPKDYYSGEPRGFGFVKFRYADDAADAKEHLNHTVISGREIRIVFAEENRKTPQEMRRISRISGSGSYRRRSPVRSPRRRYHSYSRSPSPARSDLRFLVKKRELKNSELIKTETKFIKSKTACLPFHQSLYRSLISKLTFVNSNLRHAWA
ncbi:Serine/arginine-rich SC35-like splicing factor scl28 [Sarracenia purpurea var. burkii]